MQQPPVSDEIAAALGRFFFRGAGPSHTRITHATTRTGYSDDDPFDSATQTPNKEVRIRTVVGAARRRPARARELVEALLTELRVHGCFDPEREKYNAEAVRTAQRAFRRAGWVVDDEGMLRPIGDIDLTTGGRHALDEQIVRLRGATEDPGLLIGSAKDLLEAVAKFVLEEMCMLAPANADFDHLWHLARDRLGILPDQVDPTLPGANNIKAILQSAWKIAEQVNKLRGQQGTGHGRTLPTGVTADMALLVVREACSVAEFALNRLDRLHGR